MPIHFEDVDVVSQVAGLKSVLIVPCNMCAAVTVAVREDKPFLQLFSSFLKSPPFDRYLRELQSRLAEKGVRAEVFKCSIPHQWFLCMCSSGRHKKLQKAAKRHDAAVVMGCESAVRTVREAVRSTGVRVIPGMEMTGIMNAKPRVNLSGHITFEDCQVVPIDREERAAKKNRGVRPSAYANSMRPASAYAKSMRPATADGTADKKGRPKDNSQSPVPGTRQLSGLHQILSLPGTRD